MTEPSPRRFFLSYSHKEEALGQALKWAIESTVPGARAFLSSADLPLGGRWLDVLEDQLREADAVVLLGSPESISRPWINFEAGAVFTTAKSVIPVCHSGLQWKDLPDRFRRHQGVDLKDAGALVSFFKKLDVEVDESKAQKMWSEIESARESIDYGPERPSLPDPDSPETAVLVDLLHGQAAWKRSYLQPDSLQRFAESRSAPWTIHETPPGSAGDSVFPDLSTWRAVILMTPHKKFLSPDTIDYLSGWVREGGRLAVFGFELGERHHLSNLNRLLEGFGLRFNSDIVGPPGWCDELPKPYGDVAEFRVFAFEDHPLLENVSQLSWKNVQTLEVEPGGSELVLVGGNRIGRLTADSIVDYDVATGEFQAVGQKICCVEAPHVPVAGLAPAGLTGKGGVLAVGTWEFAVADADNGQFLANVLGWLTRSDS